MSKALALTRLISTGVFVAQLYNCNISKNLSSSGQIVTDRVLYVPVASAAILKQAACE